MYTYVEGLRSGGSSTGALADTAAPLLIGAGDEAGFDGRLSHVAVYPVALTEAQLDAHYAAR
jgi:hypothetical protein